MNPAAMTKSGSGIDSAIVGPPIRMMLAGWCGVFRQSTEGPVIGRLTTPTSARLKPARAPRLWSSNAFTSAI